MFPKELPDKPSEYQSLSLRVCFLGTLTCNNWSPKQYEEANTKGGLWWWNTHVPTVMRTSSFRCSTGTDRQYCTWLTLKWLKCSPAVNWELTPVARRGLVAQCLRCLRSAGEKGNYKRNDLRELLLGVINALKKDNKAWEWLITN